ncbi:MAG: NACHT domain-containing protein [Acidobacteria bacterium]|nr:NACHT domain-containing protein [Acidobacteriota bacterium]
MFDMSHFAAYWKDRIERDLASFGDPGATVDVTGSGRTLRATWTMRGVARDAVFSVSRDKGVRVDADGHRLSYHGFIAGTDMADLRHVARMVRQAAKPQIFVPIRAEYSEVENAEPGPALERLSTLLDDGNPDATRVIMITGDAGAGKTRVLQELVRRRADDYLHGRASSLLLYVNAQGRALSRLNEALATELQDLKVGLTYHSVAVLTRLGMLVPAIDGFDELLGVSGYDDAFSSLASFLEQLEGEGQVLTSARSVYYEEEFLSRAGSRSVTGDQRWSHEAVRVLAWSEADREDYLQRWSGTTGLSEDQSVGLRKRVKAAFGGRNEELASKPLFFTRTVDLLWANPDFSGGTDLLRALVQEYLARELNDKLLDQQSRSLLSTKQFEYLMSELALEMWNQETRELDAGSVRDVAKYVGETEGWGGKARQAVADRMPTLAFLAHGDNRASSRTSIAFEHDLFFFYFLAGSIAEQLVSAGDIRIVLSRSALPEDVADRVAMQLNAGSSVGALEDFRVLLDRLAQAGVTEWHRTTQVRENAGLLAMALLRSYGDTGNADGEVEGCTVRSMVFPGSHLKNTTLRRCAFVDLAVRRTDLSTTRFVECEAKDVVLLEPQVAPETTRLELKGLDPAQVMGIRVRRGGRLETEYAPQAIVEKLVQCGAPVRNEPTLSRPQVAPEHVKTLERLMHAYHRANPICKQDPKLKPIFGRPEWSGIERLLIEHELVALERRSTSGKLKEFLRRRFLPEQLMTGLADREHADRRLQGFWRAVEELAGSGSRPVSRRDGRSPIP